MLVFQHADLQFCERMEPELSQKRIRAILRLTNLVDKGTPENNINECSAKIDHR